MILCASIAVDDDDDILDTLFTNGIDDDNGVFIFNDLFLLLALLLLSILANYQDLLPLFIIGMNIVKPSIGKIDFGSDKGKEPITLIVDSSG